MRTFNKLVTTLIITALMFAASPAQAFDWGDLITLLNNVKAKVIAIKEKHRKSDISVFGPVTYFVGDTNVRAEFNTSDDSKYHMHLKSTGTGQIEFTLNGKKHKYTLLGIFKDIRIPIDLETKNILTMNKFTAKSGTSVTISLNTRNLELPPTPEEVAPPLNPTQTSDMASSTAFIYSGANPIQTGVEPETIRPQHVAVIRGKLLASTGSPLSGVLIQALNHSEYGQTLSRANGEFDFAVNGGGTITLKLSKPGYLSAQRQVRTPWRNYVVLEDDVVLVEPDPIVTRISLGTNSPAQRAISSIVSDEDGSRQGFVYFPPQTPASLKFASGATRSVTSINVRLTELTVGPLGPKKVPAKLPNGAADTYALSFSTDEAQASGASSVEFSKPVYHYVGNFVGFAVGTVLPVGYYDETSGTWIASENGRVLKVLSVTGGLAALDINGSNVAATAAQLSNFGITTTERQQIASMFSSGQSMWRVPIKHFSVYSITASSPTTNLSSPPQPPTLPGAEGCNRGDSVSSLAQVHCKTIPIVGTPFNLTYSSADVFGHKPARSLAIPLTKQNDFREGYVRVSVAGKTFDYGFPAAENQTFNFEWNGKDAYGRVVNGPQIASIEISYKSSRFYANSPDLPKIFGVPIYSPFVTPVSTRYETYSKYIYSQPIGTLDSKSEGLGGWKISAHHAYDFVSRTLFLGDGGKRQATEFGSYVTPFAGYGLTAIKGPPGSAMGTWFSSGIKSVVPLSDGTILLGENAIQKVDTDGRISNFANVSNTNGLTVTRSGKFIFTDRGLIKELLPSGEVHDIGGGGLSPAPLSTTPQFCRDRAISVKHMTVLNDETVYFTGTNFDGLARLGPDKLCSIIPGTEILFSRFIDNAILLAYTEGQRLLVAFASDPTHPKVMNLSGESTELFTNSLSDAEFPSKFALDSRETVYFTTNFGRIYKVVEDKAVLLRLQRELDLVTYLSIGPDDAIYVVSDGNLVDKIVGALPALDDQVLPIASADGKEIYDINGKGQHLSTRDAKTGAAIFTFNYDSQGYPIAIADRDGNITRILRSGASPTAIVSPFGVRTNLSTNADGFLSSVTDAAGSTIGLSYVTGTGLLEEFKKPGGQSYTYSYDEKGRLEKLRQPDGGTHNWLRTGIARDSHDAAYVSPTNIPILLRAFYPTTAKKVYQTENANGTSSRREDDLFGTSILRVEDGTLFTSIGEADPRFGFIAPVCSQLATTPSGLTASFKEVRAVIGLQEAPSQYTSTLTLNGKQTAETYTITDRSTVQRSPAGRTVTSVQNTRGHVTSFAIDGLSPSALSYDPQGRLRTFTQGLRTSSLEYDNRGFLSSYKNPMSSTVTFIRDPVGKVLTQTLPDGRAVEFGYDANGNMTSVKPPGRSFWSLDFNSMGNLSESSSPSVGGSAVTKYAYRTDGKISSVTRPDGTNIGFVYNSSTGELTRVDTPTGVYNYSYDAQGRVLSITSPHNVTSSYAYDGSLLTQVVNSGSAAGTVQFAYNNDFNVSRVTTNSFGLDLTYDPDGLLMSVGPLFGVIRDTRNGQLLGTRFGSYRDYWTNNEYGELSYDEQRDAAGPIRPYTEYTRDKAGRLIRITGRVEGENFQYDHGYDLAGRLTSSSLTSSLTSYNHSYVYDSNSNRISATKNGLVVNATYDAQDRMLTHGPNAYTYNANGERITKTNTSGTTRYYYDSFGNLIVVELPNGDRVSYLLDGQNRRVARFKNGVAQEYYTYESQLRIAAILNANGSFRQRFVYVSRSNSPDGFYTTTNAFKIFHDPRGGLRVVINSTGATAQAIDFDDFGNVLRDSNPGLQPFGFAGCLYDRDTKLCHLGAREYDAETGRWLQRDPILFAGGDTNLYGYVLNDPVNLIDPAGTDYTWAQEGGHAVLYVDNPSGSGYKRVEFGPTPSEALQAMLFQTTQGQVDITNVASIDSGVRLFSARQDRHADMQMLLNAQFLQKSALSGKLTYNALSFLPPTGLNRETANCAGFAGSLVGGK